jgi:hypothetical protein
VPAARLPSGLTAGVVHRRPRPGGGTSCPGSRCARTRRSGDSPGATAGGRTAPGARGASRPAPAQTGKSGRPSRGRPSCAGLARTRPEEARYRSRCRPSRRYFALTPATDWRGWQIRQHPLRGAPAPLRPRVVAGGDGSLAENRELPSTAAGPSRSRDGHGAAPTHPTRALVDGGLVAVLPAQNEPCALAARVRDDVLADLGLAERPDDVVIVDALHKYLPRQEDQAEVHR